MGIQFWEAERTVYEIRNGMVFVTVHSGDASWQRCTTVNGLRTEQRRIAELLDRFDAQQRNIIAEIRQVAEARKG